MLSLSWLGLDGKRYKLEFLHICASTPSFSESTQLTKTSNNHVHVICRALDKERYACSKILNFFTNLNETISFEYPQRRVSLDNKRYIVL